MSDLEALFRHGPPRHLAHFIHVARPPFVQPFRRVLVVLAIGWLPLGVFTLLLAPERLGDFGRDIGVHARYALAAPLLVAALSSCGPRLGQIAGHFARSGLLDAAGRHALFRQIVVSRRLLDSHLIEAATVVLAFVTAMLTFRGVAGAHLSGWMRDPGTDRLSMAGLWQFAFSLPLLLTLLIGWLWRIAIWARLLVCLSRLDLRLVASHPDQCGGLAFLSQSLRAFTLFGMALGAIAAGRLGHDHLSGTSSRFTDGLLVGGSVAVVAILCAGPLLLFSGKMMAVWRQSSMAYGALAMELGSSLEARWLRRDAAPGEGSDGGDRRERPAILDAPDFSAGADLYAVVAGAQAMRFLPVDVRSVVMLVAATLLPFAAALCLTLPLGVVLATLKGLLV
ncbi:hypothetical protein [Sphingomonas sp. IC081]|uniref:hypothetical protein n=1 Tax=Sphingomonas sp. IC081 TaxID=304378 RepID=UPI0011590A29|nr:hypothetical protein [Sphingomonas sp. IC081]QDK33252.1 hypothetical protein DM450_10805 [Sphingomonas sp. IC081]